jgi:predicted metal-dependent hydrolase
MNHLLTFAQFLARRFAKEHGKLIIVRESKRMKKGLGVCLRYRFGKNVPDRLKNRTAYIIRLNIEALDNYYSPEETRDVIDHELAHTLVYSHGPRFRKVCAHMGIDKKHWGRNMKASARET